MTTGPTIPGTGGDEAGAEQLRSVLTSAAAGVQPSDGSLGQILTRAHHRTAWSWGAPLLAAAAALVLIVGVGVYASTRGTPTAQPGGHSPSASATATTPSPSPSTSPSPSASATGTATVVSLPVYYGGSYQGQTRLYREFHRVRTSDPARDAVTQAVSVAPQDPDYRVLWPAGTTVTDFRTQGSTAYVTLSHQPTDPTIGLQQVVYSVTAANPALKSVVFTFGGQAGRPVSRGAAFDTLAPVWLLQPTQGSTVSSPVTLSGQAMVFEATMNWEVDTAGGTKVASGSAMTPQAFVPGPWSVKVPLPPGHYVARGFAISAKDGSVTWADSKPFTVR